MKKRALTLTIALLFISGIAAAQNTDYSATTIFNGTITCFDVSKSNPDVIYVAKSGSGLFKTEDGGKKWKKVSSKNFAGISINDRNPETVFAFEGG